MNNKITIVCPSILPVPAIYGGAVETMLDNFLQYNSKLKKLHIDLISIYNDKAKEKLINYKFVQGWFIKEKPLCIRINSVIKNLYINSFPILYYRKIFNIVKKIGNKTVLVEGGIDCAIELRKKLDEKFDIFYHSHGLEFDKLNKAQLDVINKFSGILFVSDFCIRRAINNGVKKELCYYLMNRIDLKKFGQQASEKLKEDFRKKYGIDKDKKNIVFKGRIVKEKGVLELIKAFNKINSNNYCLLICGGRNFAHKYIFKSKYEKLIHEEIKNNANIKILGYIPYDKVFILDNLTDLSIFPSRWDEPAGLALIEAIVAQVPVIASNRGGICEYAQDAGVDFIDENNFVDSLSEKIKNILLDEEKQKEMKDKSRKIFIKYDFEAYYYELCEIIDKRKKNRI